MEIKYGDIKYFTLIRLQETLEQTDFKKLGFPSYDRLRTEVKFKIDEINAIDKHKNDCPTCEGHGIIENSFMTCDFCNGTGKRLPNPPQQLTNQLKEK